MRWVKILPNEPRRGGTDATDKVLIMSIIVYLYTIWQDNCIFKYNF
ncbi:hypothetical protein D1BOALGB6SA_10357 [Olavius sp. associated proteobacterium Delta 1]|nr:hypothetical protein D1BOALGB6SA_10357 [Olavius sp. associated proteobacterium Delta 1]